MIIKLADTVGEGISISTINRTFFAQKPQYEGETQTTQSERLVITVENESTDLNFETYRDFFVNGDISVISIYQNDGTFISTVNGTEVETVSQSLSDDRIFMHITIAL